VLYSGGLSFSIGGSGIMAGNAKHGCVCGTRKSTAILNEVNACATTSLLRPNRACTSTCRKVIMARGSWDVIERDETGTFSVDEVNSLRRSISLVLKSTSCTMEETDDRNYFGQHVRSLWTETTFRKEEGARYGSCVAAVLNLDDSLAPPRLRRCYCRHKHLS
jgi:hypothetical protein